MPAASPTSPTSPPSPTPTAPASSTQSPANCFFASSNDLVGQFDYSADPDKVVIDLTDAHIWDASSVADLDAIETKYAQRGTQVEIIGLNQASAHTHSTLSGELTTGH